MGTVSGHQGVSGQVSPMLLRRLHSQGSPHHWSSPQIPVVVQLQAAPIGTSATATAPPGKVQAHPTEPVVGHCPHCARSVQTSAPVKFKVALTASDSGISDHVVKLITWLLSDTLVPIFNDCRRFVPAH